MVGTHLLPPNLLKLFSPRPPLPYLKPLGRDPDFPLKSRASRKPKPICIFETLLRVREDREEEETAAVEAGKAVGEEIVNEHDKTGEEIRLEKIELKKRVWEEKVEAGVADYNPNEDEEIVGDPYRTLFIGRLPFSCTDLELRREFEMYGALERVRIVRDSEGKSRGYGFLVFEREKDMKTAYKDAEGLKMMNRRLLIDVERGRTVKGWKPRRLGGGLGGRPKPVVAPPADTFTATNYSAPRGGGSAFPMRGGRMGGGGGDRGGFNGGGRGGYQDRNQGGDRGGYGGGRGGFVQRGSYGGGNNFNGGNFGGDRGGYGGGDRGGYGGGGDRGGYGGDRGGYGGGGRGGGGGGGGGGGYGGDRNQGGGQFGGPADNGYGSRGVKRDGGGFDGGQGQSQRPRY